MRKDNSAINRVRFHAASRGYRSALLLRFMPLCVLVALLSFAKESTAQIYRCETPEGTVFSDEPCGDGADVIEVEDSSAGISGGPPEAVRQQLEAKRDERAEARAAYREAQALAPPPPPPPQVITVERPVYYPGYWWRPPDHPSLRPPHHRPKPVPPIAPLPPSSGGNVMRPRR